MTGPQLCPCCGQIIPPKIRLNGPVLQRIYNELRRAPRTPEQLRELVWGNRAINPHAIYVEVKLLKEKLRPHEMTVRFRYGSYRLESLC